MLLNVLKQINWVDILVLILVVRTCFIAAQSGFPIELFKFLGTLAAIYLSLHYYVVLADYAMNWLSLGGRTPVEFSEFVIFLVLAIAGYCIFVLLRSIFYRFLKMEAVSGLNKWGSLVLGVARGVFLASLIMFMMFISSIGYFRDSVKASYSGRRLFMVAPDTYSWLWSGVASKFVPAEKFNAAVTSVKEEFAK